MKTNNTILAVVFCALFAFCAAPAEAQIWKKLKKKAEDAATRKLEDKTKKETERAMDTILGNDGNPNGNSPGGNTTGGGTNDTADTDVLETPNTKEEEITMYKNSDWVPGEDLILFDDFADDPVGDFPQLWNTNGSGELTTLSDNPKKKWLKLYNDTWYEADLPKELPKDFTVEFDVRSYNFSKNKTGSQTAGFYVYLGDGKKPLAIGRRWVYAYFSPYQGWVKEQYIKSIDYEGQGELTNAKVNKDILQAFQDGMHIAISVKGKRYRVYVNGEKFFDAPRAINDKEHFGSILFDTYGIGDDQAVLISNLRIAEGLPEPRKKLFKTGSFTTNAITFDVDSDVIKPEAYGILKELAEAIKAEKGKNILIVGHTDSDGSDSHNMDLSERRAASVKNALATEFGVSIDRLTTKGKGETEPVAANDSAMNKAKNRRTEFIVQ